MQSKHGRHFWRGLALAVAIALPEVAGLPTAAAEQNGPAAGPDARQLVAEQRSKQSDGQLRVVASAPVNASKRAGHESEASVAIDPRTPNNVVVTSNIGAGNGIFKAYSTNGGATWTGTIIANGDNLGTACCDGQLQWDDFGNLFMVFLDTTATKVQLAVSTDAGQTFATLINVRTKTDGPPLENFRAKTLAAGVDQPSVAVGAGTVWVSYRTGSGLTAQGAQVTGLGQIGAFSAPQIATSSGSTANFGDIAIGPNGEVMVVYQNSNSGQGPDSIKMNVDPDGLGAAPFGPQSTITTTNVGGFDTITPQNRRSIDAEANLTWDRGNGPRRGRVYLVYTEETPDESNNTDILIRFSDNNGTTWSAPIRVNDDAGGTKAQFFPRAAVDQATGNLAVTWYDARNDANNLGAQYWGAVSTNGAASFLPNFVLGPGVSRADQMPNVNEYGDYSWVDFRDGVLYGAWADNSNSTGDNPDGTLNNADIYVGKARINVRTQDAPADFDGDSRSDLAFYRNGQWGIYRSQSASAIFPTWGTATDVPLDADFDGDGRHDLAYWRPSTGQWFIIRSTDNSIIVPTWGQNGDVPVPGDYDGDGKTDLAFWRPSSGEWWIIKSSNNAVINPVWGGGSLNPSDVPVQADYDGDSKTDLAVFRPSTGQWFIFQSSTNTGSAPVWGGSSDIPVPGDYDGDTKTDLAFFRPSTGEWLIFRSSTNTAVNPVWGTSSDIPVPGEYDGDGKMDLAFFRNGQWFIIRSTDNSVIAPTWGQGGDIPIEKRPHYPAPNSPA